MYINLPHVQIFFYISKPQSHLTCICFILHGLIIVLMCIKHTFSYSTCFKIDHISIYQLIYTFIYIFQSHNHMLNNIPLNFIVLTILCAFKALLLDLHASFLQHWTSQNIYSFDTLYMRISFFNLQMVTRAMAKGVHINSCKTKTIKRRGLSNLLFVDNAHTYNILYTSWNWHYINMIRDQVANHTHSFAFLNRI